MSASLFTLARPGTGVLPNSLGGLLATLCAYWRVSPRLRIQSLRSQAQHQLSVPISSWARWHVHQPREGPRIEPRSRAVPSSTRLNQTIKAHCSRASSWNFPKTAIVTAPPQAVRIGEPQFDDAPIGILGNRTHKSLNIFFLIRERPVVGLVFLCHEVPWGQDIHSERFPLYRLRIFRHRVCAENLDVVHRRVGAVMDLNAIACCRLTVSTT